MSATLLLLWTACQTQGPSGDESVWDHQSGTPAASVLDLDIEPLPGLMICQQSYHLVGTHSAMIEDCTGYDAGAHEQNPICKAAFEKAFKAASDTRCPEPPPVACPKQVREVWRGWKCGKKPSMNGTFVNCAVEVQVSCSQ